MMAIVVIGAMLLLLVALSSGSWAHASFADGEPGRADLGGVSDDERLDIELSPTGRVRVERGESDLAAQYDGEANAAQRAVLHSAVPGSLRDLVQVVAVLVIVVAVVGTMRPLTPATWGLVAAAALSCLVATVILRDQVTSALAASAATMELGRYETGATGSSALAVIAAGTATLVAALASGPRPVQGTAAHPLASDREGETGRRRMPSRRARARPQAGLSS